MFGKAFKIGTLLGFKLEVSWTFLIILALMIVAKGPVVGLLMVLALFGSVILHELGHAVVARRLGIPILGIELHLVGGAAKMARPPDSARDEIIIALAGPAVSFVIGAVSLAGYLATGSGPLGLLALVNLMLGVFNLVPALPMDGGRVLRAVLSERLGRLRATQIAATVAQVIAVAFVVIAIFTSIWSLLIVALLLWFLAAQERAMAGRWRYQNETHQPEVLDASGRVISGGPWHGAYRPAAPGQNLAGATASPDGTVRRVYRLPNGSIMVVEESYRF